MINYVMDYETLANLFVAVFEHYKEEKEKKVFIIHELINQLPELIHFLEHNREYKEWHVSFNGIAFDSQITEFILREKKKLLDLSGEEVAMLIYMKAQDVIERTDRREWPEYSEKDLSIKQLDVYKLNHWDNPAKRSSLKWIQYSMDWLNMQEMPIDHTTLIKTMDEIKIVVDYCINDVRSTKNIMNLSKGQINLRANLSKDYGINLYSASEPRISKELFLLFLSEKTGISKYELRQLRTFRTSIRVSDLILPYTKFKTPVFQELLDQFKDVIIQADNTKGGFKYSINYKGVKTDFGLGGVHGAISSGVYEEGNGMIIMTSDVKSYYPNLAIKNKWSPAHLPREEFSELYEWFYDERVKIPKADPRNYVYKIILNSTYGLSNDKHSFLYDPEFTMRVTINGQLSLMMLYEMLAEAIPNAKPLMQNTDGLEMMIPEEHKELYLDICAQWEKITNQELEHDQYKKIIIADVNNYIAIPVEGKPKCKGRFEYENLALHKNKSFLIIPRGLFNYFVYGKLPEQTIEENNSIFDYCGGVKIKGDWKFQKEQIVNGEYFIIPLQETIRYYISNVGGKIVKCNKTDGRRTQVEAGRWLQTPFIKFEEKEFSEYDINYKYYLDKVNKIIQSIEPVINQLKLEF